MRHALTCTRGFLLGVVGLSSTPSVTLRDAALLLWDIGDIRVHSPHGFGTQASKHQVVLD